MRRLPQLICEIMHEDCTLWFLLFSLVFDHTAMELKDERSASTKTQTHRASTLKSSASTPSTGFGVFASMTCKGESNEFMSRINLKMTHVVVVTVGTIFVALLIVGHVFAKRFLALLAHEDHLGGLPQTMVLRFSMALGAIEPLPAAWGTYGDLRVQDVFAGQKNGFNARALIRGMARGPLRHPRIAQVAVRTT